MIARRRAATARAVRKPDAEFLPDEARGKAGAVEEDVRFEPLAGFCPDRGDVAVLVHVHVDHIVEVVLDAAGRRVGGQEMREFLRVHVEGVVQRQSRLPVSSVFGASPISHSTGCAETVLMKGTERSLISQRRPASSTPEL